jgi:SAM-dependent methyltransferase
MSKYDVVINPVNPSLGGNVWQGDPWTFAPKVWKYMIKRFAVTSVLDVGAGRGHAASWFHRERCAVVAMDGEPLNVANSFYPIVQHNIADGPFICKVDMVHCQEVVEHIHEQYLANLLRTLINGDVILLTHAEPGQPGHHHVNCKPASYWVERLVQFNYFVLPDDTNRVRGLAVEEGANHIARSGLVFGKRM